MSLFTVIVLCIVCVLVTFLVTHFYTKEKMKDALYVNISDNLQKQAEMLAVQRPEVLQIYLDETNRQQRNLTELEYLMFNYYKNSKAVYDQNLKTKEKQE